MAYKIPRGNIEDGKFFEVSWHDSTNGNHDYYYKYIFNFTKITAADVVTNNKALGYIVYVGSDVGYRKYAVNLAFQDLRNDEECTFPIDYTQLYSIDGGDIITTEKRYPSSSISHPRKIMDIPTDDSSWIWSQYFSNVIIQTNLPIFENYVAKNSYISTGDKSGCLNPETLPTPAVEQDLYLPDRIKKRGKITGKYDSTSVTKTDRYTLSSFGFDEQKDIEVGDQIIIFYRNPMDGFQILKLKCDKKENGVNSYLAISSTITTNDQLIPAGCDIGNGNLLVTRHINKYNVNKLTSIINDRSSKFYTPEYYITMPSRGLYYQSSDRSIYIKKKSVYGSSPATHRSYHMIMDGSTLVGTTRYETPIIPNQYTLYAVLLKSNEEVGS